MPWDRVKDRDVRFGIDTAQKKAARKGIEGVKIHDDADVWWKEK